jgi:DNA repair protein RecN (Recombination protein N)
LIETLRIENLAIVDSAELEFGPGLNVLTGETGAGKSIVLGALALLAGGRASADAVRDGAEEAAVEAVFRTADLPAFEAELAARGIATPDHELLVRRSVARSGRHRARVAGEGVPVSLLGELLDGRIEISSQHESQGLLRPEAHARALDAFGGLLGEREAVAAQHAAWLALADEIRRLEAAAVERARREDFLAFQVQEIDAAKLVPGETARLEAERSRLVHAERLAGETAAVAALLAGDPSAEGGSGAGDLVARAARLLEQLARLDPSLREAAERARAAQTEIAELARDAQRYADSIEADPGALARAEARLVELQRLRKKYGAGEEEVLAFRDRTAAELSELAGADERLGKLQAERDAAAARLVEAAAALSRGRVAAARRLAPAVESALAELSLAGARFEVRLDPLAPAAGLPVGPGGAESVEFLFSANPGEPVRPLRRVASGGELSRVLLAMKNVLRRAHAGMVLVFDEVDAGIGGAVADQVGRALAELAAEHQVLCITHLPQVAARATTHFRVEKQERSGRTLARVVRLSEPERVEEIARMAGGARIGEATLAHARALLLAARPGGSRSPGEAPIGAGRKKR